MLAAAASWILANYVLLGTGIINDRAVLGGPQGFPLLVTLTWMAAAIAGYGSVGALLAISGAITYTAKLVRELQSPDVELIRSYLIGENGIIFMAHIGVCLLAASMWLLMQRVFANVPLYN